MKSGDYARTKSGIIGKLIIKEDTIAVAKWQGGYELQDTTTYIINDEKVYKNEIVKSSPSIIDLIEVGDYVNGYYVINRPFNQRIHTEFDDFLEEDIISIVTKEQFSQMEYKVGEQ